LPRPDPCDYNQHMIAWNGSRGSATLRPFACRIGLCWSKPSCRMKRAAGRARAVGGAGRSRPDADDLRRPGRSRQRRSAPRRAPADTFCEKDSKWGRANYCESGKAIWFGLSDAGKPNQEDTPVPGRFTGISINTCSPYSTPMATGGQVADPSRVPAFHTKGVCRESFGRRTGIAGQRWAGCPQVHQPSPRHPRDVAIVRRG
jgi:hypothetical protein